MLDQDTVQVIINKLNEQIEKKFILNKWVEYGLRLAIVIIETLPINYQDQPKENKSKKIKRMHWIKGNDGVYYCPYCKQNAINNIKTNFCPNCGARANREEKI